MPKILIIRFSSIGDIVLASPVFRCIKNQVENVEVHLVTKLSFKAVTEHNPYIDKFHYYEEDLMGLIAGLKKEQFDYVIDLHKNFRSAKIKSALKLKNYTIKKLSWQKILLTKLKINMMPDRHITLRSLDTVAPLGIKNDGKGLDYFIDHSDETKLADIPVSHHAGYIAIAIGASYHTKKLPVEKLIDLCNSIPHPIILLGGKEDAANGDLIAAANDGKIYNACGKFRLNESADLVRKSKLVISHDTGLLYIACAFQKPSFAIWGTTSPKLQVEPFYGSGLNEDQLQKKFRNFSQQLWCQPCSKYGQKKCPLGHFNCMRQQDTDAIARLALEWVHNKP